LQGLNTHVLVVTHSFVEIFGDCEHNYFYQIFDLTYRFGYGQYQKGKFVRVFVFAE